MRDVRARAREIEGAARARYAKYCDDKATELVARNVQEREKLAVKEYYDNFLRRLQDCDLVPESEEHPNIQVL